MLEAFSLEHQQLQALINRTNAYRRSVFYVFPLIGNTLELFQVNGDFYNNSWLLDVSTLPNPFPIPTTNSIPPRPRANQKHYADVIPPNVTIHSNPIEKRIESLKDVVESNFAGADGLNSLIFDGDSNYQKGLEFIMPFKEKFKMGVLYE